MIFLEIIGGTVVAALIALGLYHTITTSDRKEKP